MAYSIPRAVVENILLGPVGDRRQLQDSPILGDVWIAFAREPTKSQELLIAPNKSQSAGHVASELDDLVAARRKKIKTSKTGKNESIRTEIAALQGLIAARLNFEDVLYVIVPRTSWWLRQVHSKAVEIYLDKKAGTERIEKVLAATRQAMNQLIDTGAAKPQQRLTAFDRYAVLAGVILWAARQGKTLPDDHPATFVKAFAQSIDDVKKILIDLFLELVDQTQIQTSTPGSDELVYQVSRNRDAELAIAKSVLAVKADAAKSLFNVDTSEIAWAVLDSGIRGDHPAFVETNEDTKVQTSRVIKSYDFSNFRRIVSRDNRRIFNKQEPDKDAQREVLELLLHSDLKTAMTDREAIKRLETIANDIQARRPINWELVEPFIEIKHNATPKYSDHGTHVAGIIGAQKPKNAPVDSSDGPANGMCPNIKLYDFRVLSNSMEATEFAIIAAMQYIRYINERNEFYSIHGANLSLSIPHDVRNYACGRTPICIECERLIESGVVVVAAAGNRGYHQFTTNDGIYDGYTAFSITDPGNADGVITVGSTHRYSPHTYGVSFFSSRGPTGDGRQKPDLVAPGERIRAPLEDDWGDLDGTSMAAPHVSGAAAMLMARYSELIGQPRRIKEILCRSATDLGREKSFQGNGMLDVLRAFQSI